MVAACFLFPILRVYQATIDEGTYSYGALRILNGDLPYRDFIEPAGPGSFYWLALWFRIFGANFTTARMLLLVTGLALVLLTFALSRRLGGKGYCAAGFVLATSVPMMIMNSPHYDSNALALGAVVLFLMGRFECAGLCLGMADLCMQGKGIYILAALGVWMLWRREWGRFGKMLAGWAAPLAVTGLWFVVKGGARDALYSTVLWPMTSYGAANSVPYAHPLPIYGRQWWQILREHGVALGPALIAVAIWSVPFVLAAVLPVAALAAGWANRMWSREQVPVWAAAFALFASEMHRHDLEHLINGSILLLIVFVTTCETSRVKWLRAVPHVIALSLLLYGSVEFMSAMSPEGVSRGRRGTLRGTGGEAVLRFLQEHTRPGEAVFVYPYRPVFYFWADVKNPTRYTLLMYGYNTDEQFLEAVAALERQKVRYVLWDEVFGPGYSHEIFPAYRPPAADRLIMEPYLTSHYRKTGMAGVFSVMERRGN